MATWQKLIPLVSLFSLALIIRLSIIALHGFDGLYGQDAFAYYDFALDLLTFLKTFNPPPPFFWSMGYPLQIMFAFLIFGTSTQTALLLNIVMGSCLSVMVYILSRQFNLTPAFAFFAGILMLLSGQVLQSSLVIMSDIPALFWAGISVIAFIHYTKTQKRRWLFVCTFTISLACITRWIVLIMPVLYVIVFVAQQQRRWRDLIPAIFIAMIPLVPQFIYNHINPTPLLDHSWVQGWSPFNALAQNFVNVDGTFHYQQINALFYASPIYANSYLSPLLTIFVFIGIFYVLRHNTLISLLLLGWLILPYLFLIGIPYQNIRFPLITFPPIVILVGYGLQNIINIHRVIRWGLIIIMILGGLHTAMQGIDYANQFVNQNQSEKAIILWLDENIPPDATLYTFGSTLTLQHYTDYNIIEIFYETPSTLNQRWFKGRVDYLLINIWQIENQWQERNPQLNYHWFRDVRGLTPMGRFGNLTLFEVHP